VALSKRWKLALISRSVSRDAEGWLALSLVHHGNRNTKARPLSRVDSPLPSGDAHFAVSSIMISIWDVRFLQTLGIATRNLSREWPAVCQTE
jgi:hypothetical protein